jgi:hypothetical protein
MKQPKFLRPFSTFASACIVAFSLVAAFASTTRCLSDDVVLTIREDLPSELAEPSPAEDAASLCVCEPDRVFLVSTRHLRTDVCSANVDDPQFKIWIMEQRRFRSLSIDEYYSLRSGDRPVVIYIHGNRMPADELFQRAEKVRRNVRQGRRDGPIDWVIFSWPSQRVCLGVRDFRIKAERCDTQGLYLASFLSQHVARKVPLALIGYSFGSRIATGALHALAGGSLGGRRLSSGTAIGAGVGVGLIAPAIESHWLQRNGYHRLATKNMKRLELLYNRRDVVLKRYWLIEKVRRETALGYSGPTSFAPRFDGSRLPVHARDCSPSVRFRHSELDYYQSPCNAETDLAKLINGLQRPELQTSQLSERSVD